MSSTDCSLSGTLLGTPNVIGGCGSGTSAACTVPLVTVYAMVTTSTRRLCAIRTDISASSADVVIPSVDFSFKPTKDGYYAFYYKDERIVLELSTGSLILPPAVASSAVSFDMKYESIGVVDAADSRPQPQALVIRATGSYTYATPSGFTSIVPILQAGGPVTTNTFVLGSRLSLINGEQCLVPVVLTRDAYTISRSLPESFALTDWSATGITPGGAVVSYPLASVCSDNTKETLTAVASTFGWTGWVYLIVSIILIVLLYVMANSLRRVEYVSDSRLPEAIAVVKSMGR